LNLFPSYRGISGKYKVSKLFFFRISYVKPKYKEVGIEIVVVVAVVEVVVVE